MKHTTKLFAVLVGMLLISFVGFSGTAVAGGWEPPVPDITLASPPEVELPATIALSSPYPDVEVGACSKVGTSENCYPYLVGRSGPDANGRYLSEWSLPMAPTGAVEFWASTASLYYSSAAVITLTVTGNRFKYDDFRTCINRRTGKALISYYAMISTEVVLWLKQRVRQGKHLVWKARKPKREAFPIAHSEFENGYGPFEPHESQFRVPASWSWDSKEKLRHKADPNRELELPTRAVYLVKQGKKVLRQGQISRKPCRQIDSYPYVLP